MFVETHILQNFAPSNLNRDDTNSPKECEFGGYRRARISSQCIKRAIRREFENHSTFPSDELAVRTKRLLDELTKRVETKRKSGPQMRTAIEHALRGMKLGIKGDGKTEYLLFLGEKEVQRLADLIVDHWDVLCSLADRRGEKGAKEGKKEVKASLPNELTKALLNVLDGGKAADLALFGRMLADLPEKNIDAACQVAHALSTNKVGVEFDFYTAVDDLKPEDTAGAGMMGTIEFNSACFYRYANVHLKQLLDNLSRDAELAEKTLEAFLRASVAAIPTGKQNSMAAHNPPSYILAVVRDSGLWNLSNAFLRPIYPDGNGDLVQRSIASVEDYWKKLERAYGRPMDCLSVSLSLEGEASVPEQVKTFEELIGRVMPKVRDKLALLNA